MKKDIDKLTGLSYDVKVMSEQEEIEKKYERYLSKSPEEGLLDKIFGEDVDGEDIKRF